ncbi:MAG: ABC transporter substrate-binding protein [Alphaproteobacteria bacterium]|nr:ABC transporter substrate-binding protein [Alphaproteobacteria bacterium]TAD90831.1 MAG: ABC transporter substrate-binding protein [Alphaproteobacteria bacterium]
MITRRQFGVGAGAAASAVMTSRIALGQTQELRIGSSQAVTSMDPYFHNLGPNNMMRQHFFDGLVEQDARQRLMPGLAESWRVVNDTTWELKLRRGVKFHDGSDFTAEDVVASFKRAPAVPNSPSSFGIYTRPVREIQVIDAHTIHMVTNGPYPLLLNDISNIAIISKAHVEASTADFNSGRAMVGTGPYRFGEYTPGERVVLQRFDGYWGDKEPWQRVTWRIITNGSARVAALRAGDVDIIDDVPTQDVSAMRNNRDISVVSAPSNRVIYLHMDRSRGDGPTPFVTQKNGQPLDKNPLNDLRVRQALSMAINRRGITERTLDGAGIPASQFLPDGFFGISPRLQVTGFDADRARRLLAEAGYPQGFKITLHGPNDRYINSPQVLQAVAQMWTRIGVETVVDVSPWATYSSRASRQEFSIFLVGWGAGTGETSSPLRSLVATFDSATGFGASNRGRYSNPAMDQVLRRALQTVDDTQRAALLAEASDLAINDLAIIPLHYEVSSWATRAGLKYEGRADQYTLAMSVRPA